MYEVFDKVKDSLAMIRRIILNWMIWMIFYSINGQSSSQLETNLAGVYQGETLFIQNPFNRVSSSFCIQEILINNKSLNINYDLSALQVDFKDFDLFTPVKIKIVHADTSCYPSIINPQAVLFHTIFRFSNAQLTDSILSWSTKGEKGVGSFEVEHLNDAYWEVLEVIEATGDYSGAGYAFYPSLKEGANKYRVRYNFPEGSRIKYLYSQELELEYYPDKIEFSPKSAKTHLYFSRTSYYEIYDQGNNLVLEGKGKEADVSELRRGRYVIYFDGSFPRGFFKE